jgi:hypothetical protein
MTRHAGTNRVAGNCQLLEGVKLMSDKRNENPPPKTSPHVKHTAGKELKEGNKTERELAGSVERHIEPRKTPKK